MLEEEKGSSAFKRKMGQKSDIGESGRELRPK